MAHAIDQTRSEIGAFYGRQTPWHQLGTIVPDGLHLEEAMKASMTDFIINRRPAGMMSADGTFVPLDDKVINYREDTGAPLGVTGKDYEIIQNIEAFAFLEELVGAFGYVWEAMGALYGGRQVFAVLKVPNGDTAVSGVDEILPFIFVRNSCDGSTKLTSKASFIRPVCANTVRAALNGVGEEISIRHTKNARDRMAEAVRHDEHFTAYKRAFLAEADRLAQTPMSNAEFDAWLDELWPEPEKQPTKSGTNGKAHSRWESRKAELKGLWNSPTQANIAGSLWAAEQTVVEWLDWQQPVRKTEGRSHLTEDFIRGLRSLEGDTDDVKHKVHKKLLERVR